MPSVVRVESFFGSEIKALIPALAELRIEVFRDFPYLYEGDLDYEMNYLKIYPASPRSVLVAAFDGDQIVGASTALPLIDEADYVQAPFLAQHFDLESIYYFAESVLKKDYRGLGVGNLFFDGREKAARDLEFKKAFFCSVVRSSNHASKPPNYQSLEPFWEKRGFVKKENMVSQFSWKDLGDEVETFKEMIYWMKDL